MKFTIWHATNTRDSFFYSKDRKIYSAKHAIRAYLDGDYTKAGEIECGNIDVAWALSQNTEDAWNKEAPCRSTSVGDIIEFDDVHGTNLYIVAPCGFDELDIEKYLEDMRQAYLSRRQQ